MTLLALAGCVGLIDETHRACPCAAGSFCCASTNACVPNGQACAEIDASLPSPIDASPHDAATAPASDSAPVESGATDAGPACGAVRAPVIHFAFEDCDAGAGYHDSVSGMLASPRGSGVHCAKGPLGAALQFDGDKDGGGGSYVRVMDSPDAADHICTQGCGHVPEQFNGALTISAVLNVSSGQSFAHILGQWYYNDSYMLLTEGDDGGQRLEFSIQTADGGEGSATLAAPLPVDTWIHWVAVFSGTELRLYKDGKLVTFKPIAPSVLQCTDVPLELGQIGRQGACGGDIDYAYFKGAMGDVRLFDVALTAEEVMSLECELQR
jgi:hypothetical protein